MNWKRLLRPEILVFVLIAVFFLPACGLIFSCGCTHLWAGSDSHCNIHNPAPPNCPFCEMPFDCSGCGKWKLAIQMIPMLLMFASSGTTIYLVRSKCGSRFFSELAAGVIAAAATMLALAYIYSRWL